MSVLALHDNLSHKFTLSRALKHIKHEATDSDLIQVEKTKQMYCQSNNRIILY